MKIPTAIALLLVVAFVHAEECWKVVDEGFRLTIPDSWQKKEVKGIDSHCGSYSGNSADMEFDEVDSLLCPVEAARSFVDELKKKDADPKMLEPNEEIWHIDGRIARFCAEKADPEVYGKRRFSNVARLEVSYADEGGSLRVLIFYKDDKDLPTARKVLQSIVWNKNAPNKQEKKPMQAPVEKAGGGQPATKPADKPTVKGQPSTPTPKAAPR